MAIDYKRAVGGVVTDQRSRYADTQSLLYALSIGMGRDPLDRQELPSVFEGEGQTIFARGADAGDPCPPRPRARHPARHRSAGKAGPAAARLIRMAEWVIQRSR